MNKYQWIEQTCSWNIIILFFYPWSSYTLKEPSLPDVELIDEIEFGVPYAYEFILTRCDDYNLIRENLTNLEAVDHLLMSSFLDDNVFTTRHESQLTEVVTHDDITLNLIAQEVRNITQTCNEAGIRVSHFFTHSHYSISDQVSTLHTPHCDVLVAACSKLIPIIGIKDDTIDWECSFYKYTNI